MGGRTSAYVVELQALPTKQTREELPVESDGDESDLTPLEDSDTEHGDALPSRSSPKKRRVRR